MEVSGILYEKGMRQMAELLKIAEQVVEKLKEKGLFITTMESCTGGGVVNYITNVEGASEVMAGARVAYSCEEKIAMGVPGSVIKKHTVYSGETAVAMARAGVAAAVRADLGVGITGRLSFPDPDRKNRVFIAVVFGDSTKSAEVAFPAEYERWKAKDDVIEKSLHLVLEVLQEL